MSPQPLEIGFGHATRRALNRLQFDNRVAMTRDYDALSLERSVDQLGEFILRLGDTMTAHV